jgi:hypothetical protein
LTPWPWLRSESCSVNSGGGRHPERRRRSATQPSPTLLSRLHWVGSHDNPPTTAPSCLQNTEVL